MKTTRICLAGFLFLVVLMILALTAENSFAQPSQAATTTAPSAETKESAVGDEDFVAKVNDAVLTPQMVQAQRKYFSIPKQVKDSEIATRWIDTEIMAQEATRRGIAMAKHCVNTSCSKSSSVTLPPTRSPFTISPKLKIFSLPIDQLVR